MKNHKQFPITLSFIVLSCFCSVITWFGAIHSTLYWFIYDADLIANGQLWRLVTPIFLHFPAMGILFAHLAFNMIWFFELGSRIERSDSSRFLLCLILLSGIVSNVAQSLVSQGIFGGMSGVVYALLGYLIVRPRLSPYPVAINQSVVAVLIGFMCLSFLGLLGQNIANTAHLVGLLSGMIIAFFRSVSLKRLWR